MKRGALGAIIAFAAFAHPAPVAAAPATGFYEKDRGEEPAFSIQVKRADGSRVVSNLLVPLPGCENVAAGLASFEGGFPIAGDGRFSGTAQGLSVRGRFAGAGATLRVRTDNGGCVASRRYLAPLVNRRPVADGDYIGYFAGEPDQFGNLDQEGKVALGIRHGGRVLSFVRFFEARGCFAPQLTDPADGRTFVLGAPISPTGRFEADAVDPRGQVELAGRARGSSAAGIGRAARMIEYDEPYDEQGPRTLLCDSGPISFATSLPG